MRWQDDPIVDEAITNGNAILAAHAAIEAYKQTLKTRIEKLPHGWAETGADDGQGHREGFEACAYSAVLAMLEEQ